MVQRRRFIAGAAVAAVAVAALVGAGPVAAQPSQPASAAVPIPLDDLFELEPPVHAVAPGGDHDGSSGQADGGVGSSTWTVTPTTYTVRTGPEQDLEVTIDADLYVPSTATEATPAPAIISTHGFGNAKDSAEQRANGAYFASHGYIFLSYSSQGFGGSSSCIALDTLDFDVRNASALIDELAAMPIVATDAPGDPKVGIIGGSYGAGLHGGVAATDDRLDAVAFGRSWFALRFSLVPNNWIPDAQDPWDLDGPEQGVFKREWTSLFFALGASGVASGAGGCDPVNQQLEFPGSAPCPGFVPEVCPIFAGLSATGDSTADQRAFIGRSSMATMVDGITTPTMFLQGLPDTLFTPTEATAAFAELRRRGVETAMIWHSGGHGGYQAGDGEAEPYGGAYDETPESQARFAASYLPRRTLQWFDRHVRGLQVDTGPAFAWFRDDVEVDLDETGGTAAPAYGASDTFPVAEETVLALDPNTSALVNRGSLVGGTASMVNPPGGLPAAYSETANFSAPGQPGDLPATEIPGQHLTFTSEPFTEATELVGVPRLRLTMDGVAPVDLRFFAKVYDVDTEGDATLVRRQVAPARVPADVAAGGQFDVHLVGGAHTFEPGHALRIVLATTDAAYANEVVANQLTLSSTPTLPSLLSVRLLTAPDVPDVPEAPASPTTPAPPTGAAPTAPDGPTPAAAAAAAPAPAVLPSTGGGLGLLAIVLVGVATTFRRRS